MCCSSRLKSNCSKYFDSCGNQGFSLDCDSLVSENSNWIPDISKLQGPLDKKEIDKFKKSKWVSEQFRINSTNADSYWWYVEGYEKNGSQGVVAIKGCTVIAYQFVELWILDDIAILHNNSLKPNRSRVRVSEKCIASGRSSAVGLAQPLYG